MPSARTQPSVESADARAACRQAYISRPSPIKKSSGPGPGYYNTLKWENLDVHGNDHLENGTVRMFRTADGQSAPGAQAVIGHFGRTVYNGGKNPKVTGQGYVAGVVPCQIARPGSNPTLEAMDEIEIEVPHKDPDNLYAILTDQHDEMVQMWRVFQDLNGDRREEMDGSEGDVMFQEFINAEQCVDFGYSR